MNPIEVVQSIRELADALPAAQRSAREYALAIDLFSGEQELAAAHPSGMAYVAATKLALIESEASEAIQEVRQRTTDLRRPRRDANDPLSAELADIVLRTLELAEYLEIDLGLALQAKVADTVHQNRHGGVHF